MSSCPPSQAKSKLFRLLRYPRRLPLLDGSCPSAGACHGWCDVSCTPSSTDRWQPLLPGIDLSFIDNPSTPSQQLVVAVQCLEPFLPSEYKVLGEGDLKISGPSPVSEGGFAEVWVGEMKDGTKVAIKLQRRHSSSSCLPAFLVSNGCYTTGSNVFSSPDVIYRGCTGKH